MMLGLSRVAMAGGKAWTNPYVTNGLVAMWDGEWNGGGGIHTNDHILTDLIGSNDQTFSDSFGIYDKFIRVNAFDLGTWLTFSGMDAYSLGESTVSVHVKFTPNGYNWGRPFSWREPLEYEVNQTGRIIAIYAKGIELDVSVDKSYFTFTYTQKDGTINVYYDGILKFSRTGYTLLENYNSKAYVGNMTSGEGRTINTDFYTLRVYNRALSTSEIAANYTIDQARFGLA